MVKFISPLFHACLVLMVVLTILLGSSQWLFKTLPVANNPSLQSAAVPAAAAETITLTKKANPSLKLIIGGDVMLDRYIRKLGEKNGYDNILAPIAPLLKTADIALVNLEGPITSSPSQTLLPDGTLSKVLIFTFTTDTAPALATAGVDLVSLANNHSDNFGLVGLAETKKWLASAGIDWFGGPWNNQGEAKIICQSEMCLAFVGYNEFNDGFEQVLTEVRELEDQVDFTVVMPHWGEEYVGEPTDQLKTKAKSLVEAGADLIVGAHPHVIMSNEEIGGVPVFYSLGNLLFDQYFSPETMVGELLEIDLKRDDFNNQVKVAQIKIHQVSTVNRQTVEIVD